jgi:hypothetical protein
MADCNYNRVSITLTAEFDLRADHPLVKIFMQLPVEEQNSVLAGTLVNTMQQNNFISKVNRNGSWAFLRSIQ